MLTESRCAITPLLDDDSAPALTLPLPLPTQANRSDRIVTLNQARAVSASEPTKLETLTSGAGQTSLALRLLIVGS
jgi:hypothetical protein